MFWYNEEEVDTMDLFIPDIYAQSIFTINYDKLKERNIKCILFDLDNTIAPISMKEPDKKIKDLFARIEDKGFKVIIVSNSAKKRVAPFKEKLNVDAACSAMKPSKKKYKKIMKLYQFKEAEIAAVGDQLLTDILGANRMGFTSILVNPLHTSDFIFTKFNRKIESHLMKRMGRRGLFKKGEYYE